MKPTPPIADADVKSIAKSSRPNPVMVEVAQKAPGFLALDQFGIYRPGAIVIAVLPPAPVHAVPGVVMVPHAVTWTTCV